MKREMPDEKNIDEVSNNTIMSQRTLKTTLAFFINLLLEGRLTFIPVCLKRKLETVQLSL